MSRVSSYGIAMREDGVIAVFPAMEVAVEGAGGDRLQLVLLLDSGASTSALPKSDAAALGIDVIAGDPQDIAGIGDVRLRGWRHDLTVRIGDEQITAPFLFVDAARSPRVLGRAGFFDRFTIVIEEQRRRSACVRTGSLEALRITETLDNIGAR